MNSVSAMVTGERPLSSVRTRRTAVTFDSAGSIRIGGIPQFDMAVTDFADLARDPESVVVGGRLWSPANLVAAVVNGLVESFPPTAGAVATYPACYSDKQLSLLRQALNLAGAADVLLIPEPVAAAEWLEQERGPLESGFVLVYDLGGASLDVSMVRVGPDWDDHPIVGKSVRSYDFGGRPLGSMIARYARVAEPGDNGSMLQMTSIVDITSMRAQHIRDSLDVVHECVESTGRCLSDISCILLVGGATRPVEVARILAELGRPVVMSSDPGQTVAVGAAGYAARSFAPMSTGGRHRAPKVAVFSSAAVASAVAVSAVTVFGGPNISQMPSLVDASPGSFPMDNLLLEPDVEALAEAGSAAVGWATTAAGFGYSGRPAYGIAPVAHTTPIGPTIGPSVAEAHGGRHSEPRGGTAHSGGVTYANPAQFLNPLPFIRSPRTIPAVPNQPATGTPIPSVSLPGSFPAPANSTPAVPAGNATTPGTATPGTATPGTATPATGGTSTGAGVPGATTGETSTGTGTSGGTASDGSSGGSTGDASGGTTSGTSGSTSGNSTSGGSSGSTSGGSTSTGASGGSTGGGTSGGSADGGASGGSSSGGGSGSTGGGASGGSTNGGTSGGSASGGTSGGSTGDGMSGGSTGGGTSGGSADSGASGGSASGGTSGGSTGGGMSGGSTGGGMSGGSTGGGMSGGSTSGGTVGGSTGGGTSGGTSAGATGGSSSNGRFSGGNTSGGSTSSGGASSGGGFSGGGFSHGSGGGGGARR
ncbi:Hsp70 family protein [Nocardia vinacea]|uniref:Hsp70 family protein n=1 Tax=Nocardia vinacea TaxID=96468 RepID=UPI002E15EFDD|nr:Hsp70 family protein [Nocardia vinacea]